MASSKLRTHQGKSISNNDGSRSTITGLLQRDPTADQFQRLPRSLQSVRLDGGVPMLVTADKAGGNWSKSPILTLHLAHPAIPEFVICDNESGGDQSDINEFNVDNTRHNHRGFHER